MTDLSQRDIEDIVLLLGGGLTAELTDSMPQMPSYWTTSLARPTHTQMARLVFVKELLEEIGTSMDDQSVREWLINVDDELGMPPCRAIKRDDFAAVRASARRASVTS